MSYRVGVDLGSTAIKTVFVKDGSLVWFKAVPTAPGQEAIASRVIEEGLQALQGDKNEIEGIAATGYGKNLFHSADKVIDEVSANALGMHILSGGEAKMIINIGGQDIKIIKVDSAGKLIEFKMNDKCAAGTGRFLKWLPASWILRCISLGTLPRRRLWQLRSTAPALSLLKVRSYR